MEQCRITSFSELYTLDFELDDVFAVRQTWRNGALFQMSYPRRTNGIILLCGAGGKYTDTLENSFLAPVGSVVCLPEGSMYSVLNLSDGLDFPDAYLIEFRAFSHGIPFSFGKSPFLIKNANFCFLRELAEKAALAYEAPIRSLCAVKAGIYAMLCSLGEDSLAAYHKRFASIAKGIDFLQKNPHSSVSVEEIAKMCHVSSTNFRKLFKEYSGKSPTNYRIDLKIDTAKRMLVNENVSLAYIADSLGFESEAYFSRLFKKKVGCSPSIYKENQRKEPFLEASLDTNQF